jgi:hypothetical protein
MPTFTESSVGISGPFKLDLAPRNSLMQSPPVINGALSEPAAAAAGAARSNHALWRL